MKAVVVDGLHARLDRNRKIPELPRNCIRVKPIAIALNPTDWKHFRYGRAKDGCIVGCDYAGVVEEVGCNVTKGWRPGDRVFGCGHGGNLVNPDDGVFAETAVVVSDIQMRIPDRMTFEQAATIGLGSFTVGQGLYQKALNLDLPTATTTPKPKNVHVLISGGATATGALGIQYARQSGYSVVTTCGLSDFDYVKSLGAEFVVDYMDKDAGEKIREYTNNKLKYAWDTVSVDQTAQLCADALSTSETDLVYGTLLPVHLPRTGVKTVTTVMHTVFGRDFVFGPKNMPASKEDFDFAKQFSHLTEMLLEKGLLRPHTLSVHGDGLEGAIEGLKDIELGKFAGRKLVYLVDHTP